MTDPKTLKIKPAYSERQRIRRTRFGLYAIMGLILVQYMLSGCAAVDKSSRLELIPVTDSPTGGTSPGEIRLERLAHL